MLQDITYVLPNQEVLFHRINISVSPGEKLALIGNNGSGKSTLFKIIAGKLEPESGNLEPPDNLYYLPQVLDQYNHQTIAEALGISQKLLALRQILNGDMTEENLETLADDWSMEERCQEALEYWGLKIPDLNYPMQALSGGQRTRVLLSGIQIHSARFVLLDEPTNHLDRHARNQLYDFVRNTSITVFMISHDRTLLNLAGRILELGRKGITSYGGNYDFYKEQKRIQSAALELVLQSKEKELKKAKEKERETVERQQKLDARGKKKQEKAGVARIMMNTLRNKAENSTSRLKGVHEDKISAVSGELRELRAAVLDIDKMKFGFEDSILHKGKVLFSAENLNWRYADKWLWNEPLQLRIESGERVAVHGINGSGKSTLMKIISGEIEVQGIYRAMNKMVYVDQNYSLLQNSGTVYEQVQAFNSTGVPEHEVKTNLHRLLFSREDWNKPCFVLSGGERMRLTLCCITISGQSPDLLILDEPTNNLDIQNVEILTRAIQEYQGTLLVISHDSLFLEEVGIQRNIHLK